MIAYIISAYRYPQQLIRLVDRLNSAEAHFYIHIDKKTDARIYRRMCEPLRRMPNVTLLARHACYWGGFGHVRASLKAINAMVDNAELPRYAILLTGQDYPIKPTSYISDFLGSAKDTIFMRHHAFPYAPWAGGADRFENWHLRFAGFHFSFPDGPPSEPAVARVLRSPLRKLMSIRRKLPAGLVPYGGSSYWCFPGDCIRYIHEQVRENPSFVRFFKYVEVPDEMFFQTMLLNSPLRERVVDDDLRHIEWSRTSDNPEILRTEHFATLKRSPALFARKFDSTVDEEILDRIDREILGRPQYAVPNA